MCLNNLNLIDAEMNLDDDLLKLYKSFKEINESEAGENLDDEDLIVDFIFTIQDSYMDATG